MKRAAIVGAVFLFAVTVVAYASIARDTWTRAGAGDSSGNLRQFLSQIIAEAPHPMAGRAAPILPPRRLKVRR